MKIINTSKIKRISNKAMDKLDRNSKKEKKTRSVKTIENNAALYACRDDKQLSLICAPLFCSQAKRFRA